MDANLKDAIISEDFPLCDRKTVLPDGTYPSSNHDLYRFVDHNRGDFWKAPFVLQTDSGCSDNLEDI
jgi:hypothetical protein